MEYKMDKDKIIFEIKNTINVNELNKIRIRIFGKNGSMTEAMKSLSEVSDIEEKKLRGAELNIIKTEIEDALSARINKLETIEINAKLRDGKVDVSLPFTDDNSAGLLHPFTRVIDEVCEIFSSLGFKYATGPHIENDFYNFTALNIGPHHPSRDMRDTFYLQDCENLLRTETSAVQIRTMEKQKAPVKIFAPGAVFRNESDATHSPMFHQVEGLWVDEKITMQDLLGVLTTFLKEFFCTDSAPIKIRQHHFPFTEPSIEIDVRCEKQNGQIKIGQGNDWIELLGAGMVHPSVLKTCGIDANKYQGFAFGCGLERLAMVKYGMPDVREFYNSNINWLKHYGFKNYNNPSSANGLNGNS
jgi:phenylalanyl-tRNA synthetase alpha chain